MIRSLFALTATIALMTFGPTATATTDTGAADTSSVIVYRADESIKTRRINFDVHVDKASVGRLAAKDALVAAGDPGTYTIGTSLPGDTPLVLELKPGSTHYVHTRLRMVGNRVIVELVEVEEQVARAHELNPTFLTI